MKRYSKFLSYVLRHRPDELGLELDDGGWVAVDELLAAASLRDDSWTLELLEEVVATNDKQRFEFSPDGVRIRARQGHSVDVELGLEPVEPPETLYHGTVAQFVEAIQADGLKPMSRHAVHLSPDVATATVVGSRRGKPIILSIAAREMYEAGFEFRRTGNDVWLVDHVPPEYLVLGS